MKVGIIGHKGWIAGLFKDVLQKQGIEFVNIEGRAQSNEIMDEIKHKQITHVLYVAGRTHGVRDGRVYPTIDYLQTNDKLQENVRDNLLGPVKMALWCQQNNIHMAYLGTGCIFSYTTSDQKDIFVEDSRPNFFGSNYSIVKGFTDELMHQIPTALNWRIRMPITSVDNPRNFISKIIRYEKICSISNSMTVLDEMIPVMVQMMVNREVGTWNMTNPGKISHNEILEMYKAKVDPTFSWQNFTEAEQAEVLTSGRSNNELDVKKLTAKYQVLPIHKSVEQVITNWKS